jgi:type VI secretion system secreted protein Hcp
MKRWIPLVAATVAGLLITAAAPPGSAPVSAVAAEDAGLAAVDMFLKIEGVDGESADSRHRGWIDVLSVDWDVTRPSGSTAGARTSAPATFGGLTVSKTVDKSSPSLYLACADGRHVRQATLVAYRAGESARPYYEIVLTDVMVTAVGVSGGPTEDALTEYVTLNFRQVQWTYTPMDASGRGRGQVTTSWDIETGREL